MTRQPVRMDAEAEETVYSGRYSNNGSIPMWCLNNTCIVRQGEDVFASVYQRVPGAQPLNDCRWTLCSGCPMAGRRLLLSANPTLLPLGASGGGPALPGWLLFEAANLAAPPRTLLPVWQGRPTFSVHSGRTSRPQTCVVGWPFARTTFWPRPELPQVNRTPNR